MLHNNRRLIILLLLALFFYASYIFYVRSGQIVFLSESKESYEYTASYGSYGFYELSSAAREVPSLEIITSGITKFSAWLFVTPWPAVVRISQCDDPGFGCILVPVIYFVSIIFLYFVYYFIIKKIIDDKKWFRIFLIIWVVYVAWGAYLVSSSLVSFYGNRILINNVFAQLEENGIDLSSGRMNYYYIMKPIGRMPATPPDSFSKETNYYAHPFLGDSLQIALEIEPYGQILSFDPSFDLKETIKSTCKPLDNMARGLNITEYEIIQPEIFACYRYYIAPSGKKMGRVSLYKALNNENTIIGSAVLGDNYLVDIDEFKSSGVLPDLLLK